MIFSCILMMLLIISTLGENCDDILCANIFDEVCGMGELKDGTQIIMKYKNICYMRKKECKMESFVEINQVADELCNIKKRWNKPRHDDYQGESRRVFDHSILGAYQPCNHTCPIYCTDVYEPACAQIWQSYTEFNQTSIYRPMINHCHIDMFSCAAGVNVTLHPLHKCLGQPAALYFKQQMAGLKALRLLDKDTFKIRNKSRPSRRTNIELPDMDIQISLKKHLEEVVRRIFDKYRNGYNQEKSYY